MICLVNWNTVADKWELSNPKIAEMRMLWTEFTLNQLEMHSKFVKYFGNLLVKYLEFL